MVFTSTVRQRRGRKKGGEGQQEDTQIEVNGKQYGRKGEKYINVCIINEELFH
jgi:predicted SprT family Zn-dependent metalloprotease